MRTESSLLGKLLGLAIVCTFTMGADSCSSGDSDRLGGSGRGPTFVTELALKSPAGAVRREFAPGEPITLELSVRNRSSTDVILQFGSGQLNDAVVVDAGTDRIRWRWSHGKAFPTLVTEVTFAPGETQTFPMTWDQLDNAKIPVEPGRYEARGVLLFEEFTQDPLFAHQLGSPLKPFTIR